MLNFINTESRDPGLQCGDCKQFPDNQSHCLVCPACTDDKDRLDLTFIEDIEVIFYQRVLNAREQKGGKRTAGTLL